MRGKKAKTLRGYAGYRPGTTVTYGQQEISVMKERLVREPGAFGVFKMVKKKFTHRIETGARICVGPRAIYKQLKAMAKR